MATSATIYLAPKDYHRIHMPLDGVLESMVFVPGIFSVNPSPPRTPNLFAPQRAVVATFRTPIGPMALVLVGATIVASIELHLAATYARIQKKKVVRWGLHRR